MSNELREEVARQFHEAYERLAPNYGYETREASGKPWEEVPINNRQLMMAVAEEVMLPLIHQAEQEAIKNTLLTFYEVMMENETNEDSIRLIEHRLANLDKEITQ